MRINIKPIGIEPGATFCKALRKALTTIEVEPKTRQDIPNTLRHVEKAARMINFDTLAIKDVKRKHIKLILEQAGVVTGYKNF